LRLAWLDGKGSHDKLVSDREMRKRLNGLIEHSSVPLHAKYRAGSSDAAWGKVHTIGARSMEALA
jgi:hypothetical protein